MKLAQYVPQIIASLSPTAAMEIRLTSKQTVFTTGDTLQGELVFHRRNAPQGARVSITLFGRTSTTVTKTTPFPNSGSIVDYTFLQMHHSEALEACHHRRILPFSFVIPGALPSDPCSEHVPSGTAAHHGKDHLQLPPSVDQNSDRFCPEMCSIVYYVHAEVDMGNQRLHATRQVQLLPLYPEQPPRLWPEGEGSEVQMSDTTGLRMCLLGAKTGHVTVRAREAKPLYLPPGQHHGSTMAPIRFDLGLESLHPELTFPDNCQVKVTLEAATYFTLLPMDELPSWQSAAKGQGQCFRASVCSWKNKSVGLQWMEKAGNMHTASLVVPIPVSGDVALVPTFHHCYVAREYFARVEVTVGCSRTLRVKVPVQIYNSLER
ncbi:hypothetical protein ANOM_008540 [Aspergillus nomiae NRRL 13137]|uniref:Bul1 C-terminal domain-containing protein n=1 Tax=Aspergillus nomiae NRRL (strain ATCC 15546 / NRRL 13137 / CBS 260.88 / M93) TaxID=1509407 RepID=A0A0L1IVP8_ASPN3|nr:uncharacterized protein ANOM_008540 [Aspergillus nomiae NRRL 13137]KNG83268.1 hypothetical protein ANOM_008540 [Aspergillus nomiae NRRL 13137]